MTDANGNYSGRSVTPQYVQRVELDERDERLDRAEERLRAIERAHGIDTATILERFETHEQADVDRHAEVLARLDRLDDRIDTAIRDAAGARALAERQPSQAEAVLVDMARADIEAAKERRAHLWAGARRVGAWLLGGGGMAVLGAAAARACGG